MRKISLSLLLVAALEPVLADDQKASATPLEKINRKIAAEPKYQSSAPLYGLYVLDDAHKTRVWAVLDKTSPDKKVYDVLYFDRNANGKLTDEGERIENEQGSFELGDFVDPNSNDRHTIVKLARNNKGSVMFGLNWKGKHRVGGGYPKVDGPYTMFGKTAAEAPIVKVVGEGAFAVQTWSAPKSLKIGNSDYHNDIKFFVGHAGVGASSFSSVMHPFLPKNVALEATLIYESTAGKKTELKTKLTSRC